MLKKFLLAFSSYAIVAFGMQAAEASPSNASCAVRRAIVAGSTGATGKEVVKALVRRNWEVFAISRREYKFDDVDAAKITFVSSEMDTDELTSLLQGSVAFFNCLGTTRGQAGSAEEFVRVEVSLTQKFGHVAKRAGVKHVAVVSAQGANKNAWVPTTAIHPLLYVRTMGEKEQAIIDEQFQSTTIFQPGMLNRLTGDRAMENYINWLMPALSLRVDDLALAMVLDAENNISQLDSSTEGASPASSAVSYISGNSNIQNRATAK
jgi:oxidoreductase